MSKPIIEVKNLSKVYNIGHEQKSAPGTLTFRDSLAQTLRKPLEIFTGHRIEQEKFWALKNVNFEVNQGDVVGIIGRNGSGKSTLLKVLSRIVEPTEGEITMRGRVASLLEVGTGFHPELTGRENVYFNGAILGMSQKEIKSKFDEIVAFSEVEKFLDTPVKFYSSGMYVRLAFAVAAHLDPDILIVDEVLAVGDAAFQKKCLGKMKDVAGQGRTVLFVSHSMAAVQSLCNKGILMEQGRVKDSGNISKIVSGYTAGDRERGVIKDVNLGVCRIKIIRLSGSREQRTMIENPAIPIKLSLTGEGECQGVDIGIGLRSVVNGIRVAFIDTISAQSDFSLVGGTQKDITIKLPKLAPGDYELELHVWRDKNLLTADHRLATITVLPYPMYGQDVVSEIETVLALEVEGL